jgi:predicted Zn finger-like uncharacterized protein
VQRRPRYDSRHAEHEEDKRSMKITCQSCQAKYTIADEKVLGKTVKIRCKKCASTIVVNGNDPSAVTTESVQPEALRAQDSTQPSPASAEGWTVNVTEGDQRTMTDAEVVAAFKAGTIDADTFIWKDGMDDWVALREQPALFAACKPAASATAPRPGGGSRTAALPASTAAAAPIGAASAAASNGTFGGAAGAQAAARRAGGRAPAADLFGGVAQAGGEEDVLTSAPSKMPQPHEDASKGPIGARNENSVLFSINAVTTKGASSRPPPPAKSGDTNEASGLIDIRQLSAQLSVEDKKRSRVDDIMNLSAGGAFVPNLAAPSLTAPVAPDYGAPATSLAPGARNKGLIFLAVAAGLFVIVGAVGIATVFMHKSPAETEGASASAEKTEKSAAIPSANDTTASSATASAAAAPSASAQAAAAATTTAPAEPTAAATSVTKPSPEPAHEAPRAVVAAPRPAPVESDQPFNMGEAKAKLGAAASAAAGCKKPNGPTGTGRAVIVFAPSGAAQSASINGEPFEGTPTGACVASKFRAVRVPPFSGSPFSVSKSFTVN